MNRRRNIQCPILFLYVLKWCFCQGSDNVGNLIDPCNFPSPQFANLAGLCQFHYHQVKYVCDPLALLSRTETEILEKRFQNYSLSGCVDCKANPGRGCLPSKDESNARISVLIVPYTNTERIESCLGGRYRKSHFSATDASRSYAEIVQRNWAESGCTVDLTLLYIGTVHNPMTNIRQPHPFIVRLFGNHLSHLSQMSTVKMIDSDKGLFETLQSELSDSLSMAQIGKHLTDATTPRLNQKPVSGVPLWAFEICAILLLLVIVMVYIGNYLTKRFNNRTQQKKSNNRSNGLSAQNKANGINGSDRRLASSSTQNVGSNPNTSLTGNLAVQNTKSSMMFRQFSTHNAKKQKDLARANIQKI